MTRRSFMPSHAPAGGGWPLFFLIANALVSVALSLVIIAIALAVTAAVAAAHDAPKGWKYDWQCCSNMDCREVPGSYVQETWAGYHLTKSQEVIPYGDKRIKDSPDGMIHWCTRGGTDSGKTICLYMPPRGY